MFVKVIVGLNENIYECKSAEITKNYNTPDAGQDQKDDGNWFLILDKFQPTEVSIIIHEDIQHNIYFMNNDGNTFDKRVFNSEPKVKE